MPYRRVIIGHPHTYAIQIETALAQPVLAGKGETVAFLEELERVRIVFDARCFAYAITPRTVHLVISHRTEAREDHATLRQRWLASGGGSAITSERLYDRLTSLAGLMQTLLQRYSRGRNRRVGERGSLWATRYRACLLADDTATLAATAWVERGVTDPLASSRNQHGPRTVPVILAAPPLLAGPDQLLMPTSDAPLGLSPPSADERQGWLDRFCATLSREALPAYGAALAHGWALGRPESLAEALARLGRVGGRGRGRVARDLADDLGLCGVWG